MEIDVSQSAAFEAKDRAQKMGKQRTVQINCRLLVIFMSLLWLCGCNHLLYYPTRVKYVDPAQLSYTPQEITVNTEAGEKLVGWYFVGKQLAKQKTEGKRPTILFFHGNGQNISSHFYALYWLLDEGYDYLIFDYPGYGGSEGEPTPKSTVESGRLFYQWLKAHKRAVGPLVIFGQSLGGAVAMRTAADLPQDEDLCLVIVDSTFASYQGVAKSVLSRHWSTWPIQWLPYLVLSDTYAPKSYIEQISPIPLVVAHGKNDKVIEYKHGEEVFRLAREPKEFWPLEDGEHIDLFHHAKEGQPTRARFLRSLNQYCQRERKS